MKVTEKVKYMHTVLYAGRIHREEQSICYAEIACFYTFYRRYFTIGESKI